MLFSIDCLWITFLAKNFVRCIFYTSGVNLDTNRYQSICSRYLKSPKIYLLALFISLGKIFRIVEGNAFLHTPFRILAKI